MARAIFLVLLLGWSFILSACAESLHQIQREAGPLQIPPDLLKDIDTSVTFSDLRANTDSYLGRTISLAGIVLTAKRFRERTELEILQLPRREGRISTKDRVRSEGRFLAIQETFLDPATVPPGTPVTIIGTVQGSITRQLDEAEYLYPIVAIKHLIDWNMVDMEESETAPAAFYGPYYYPPFGYWGVPYGYYPFWTRPYPFIVQPRPPSRPPSSSPPSGIPPRFKRR
ncbi:MAG: Slp family lipoprotein [Nitrospira sp.]|nr:Slp family lipoprotein [Nitrospira sp.]